MKKLNLSFLFVFSSMFLFSFTLGASLSISPSEGTLGSGCIESFDITLDMNPHEQIVASDIIIDSNLSFVDFVNGDVFEYSAPVKQKRGLVKLLLFSSQGNDIVNGGNVGTIYMNVPSDVIEPYIKFVFSDIGDTMDTNLSINGTDILSFVRGGNYAIDSNKVCVHGTDDIVGGTDKNLDVFLEKFESDHKLDRIRMWIRNNVLILIGAIVIILVIFIIMFFIKKKKKVNV